MRIPRYIQYFPGVVLDVLSIASESIPVESSMGTPSMISAATINSALIVGQADALADPPTDPSSEDKVIEDLQVTSALAEMSISDIGTRQPHLCTRTLRSTVCRLSPWHVPGRPYQSRLYSRIP
ncbi:hypothetical protein KVV02_002935 [Mortierella alpina]|uniref:Uncharacterized protein n=1 Tax=Mortierella alpina TaxID=64518 RepID=A0A9P8CZI2_MORAP|nr:hypothetical protein KVV02_002935 [Mortierella alpina]